LIEVDYGLRVRRERFKSPAKETQRRYGINK
jgi:hypothetical protein